MPGLTGEYSPGDEDHAPLEKMIEAENPNLMYIVSFELCPPSIQATSPETMSVLAPYGPPDNEPSDVAPTDGYGGSVCRTDPLSPPVLQRPVMPLKVSGFREDLNKNNSPDTRRESTEPVWIREMSPMNHFFPGLPRERLTATVEEIFRHVERQVAGGTLRRDLLRHLAPGFQVRIERFSSGNSIMVLKRIIEQAF